MKATKILKTVKNISWATLKVRNSDWVKWDIANNWTFVTYKWKELLRMYKTKFSIASDENPETPVYKITAISDSQVEIVDKKWKEVISMKVEEDKVEEGEEQTYSFYLGIGWEWKKEEKEAIITKVTAMIEEVAAGDNIVKQEDAQALVTEYNTLS